MYTDKETSGSYIPSCFSRRKFLQTTVGSAFALALTSCDQVEDPFETYTGPEIDEADFIASNARYHDIAVDTKTQFLHTSVVNGATSGNTDPVAIAYRLQYLIDNGDAVAIETLLDHLLLAQENSISFIDYRGFIPTLNFQNNSSGFAKAAPEFRIPDNAALSARVAMAADAFPATNIETKAMAFLANQKEGYNYYLSGDNLFFPVMGSATTDTFGEPKVDLLFSEFYAELAFVLSYFIGDSATIQDPQVGISAWQALTSDTAIPTAQHGDSFTALITLSVPLARDGSGYQYFQSLLALPTTSISANLSAALYNALYSFLDAARYDNLPGIFSAGPNAQGTYLASNGLSRLTAPGSQSAEREMIATVDALAAATRLFPEGSTERQTIRRWMGLYNATPGTQSDSGLYGGVDKAGNVAPALYARQNAAMILMNSNAPSHLESFLQTNNKMSMREMFELITISLNGVAVQKIEAQLPLPPPEAQLFMANA